MDGLEDQPLVLALHVDDALGAQDVGPLLGQQLVEPTGEGLAVDGLFRRQADALDVVMMGVAARAVVVVVVPMIVVMVVAAVLVVDVAVLAVAGVGELGPQVVDAIEVEAD